MKIIITTIILTLASSCSSSKLMTYESSGSVIAKKLESNVGSIQKCYSDNMINSKEAGVITLTFFIVKSGETTKHTVKINKGMLNIEIQKCIIKIAKKIKFPSIENYHESIMVRQPLNLYPTKK